MMYLFQILVDPDLLIFLFAFMYHKTKGFDWKFTFINGHIINYLSHKLLTIMRLLDFFYHNIYRISLEVTYHVKVTFRAALSKVLKNTVQIAKY